MSTQLPQDVHTAHLDTRIRECLRNGISELRKVLDMAELRTMSTVDPREATYRVLRALNEGHRDATMSVVHALEYAQDLEAVRGQEEPGA